MKRLALQCVASLSRINMAGDRRLIIMAKAPVAGRVKSRLGQDIGTAPAANFYRHTCRAVVSRLSQTRLWETTLCIAPDTSIHDRIWPPNIRRKPQGEGDLGERMHRAMMHNQDGPVVLIGTDIPEIRPSDIADAFRNLRNHDVVFGSTPDGGYWLVGSASQRYLRSAFRNVRWSTEYALTDTINSFRSQYNGLKVGLVRQLNDVDHGVDLLALQALVGRRILPRRLR
ncbi:MAG: TIGR04282 family arsenosugar biosynthesis glycosyltransferase [Pseudomonadota bacterium]